MDFASIIQTFQFAVSFNLDREGPGAFLSPHSLLGIVQKC
jgi:hypothetical protein